MVRAKAKAGAGAPWRPAIEFDRCYLSVYCDRPNRVYLSREAYWLMGRPKLVRALVQGGVVALSPSDPARGGLPVRFNPAWQPYVVCRELGEAIGPGNRAVYDYDEQVRERGRFGARLFYFKKK
jgi:hypothetical protein